MSDNPAVLPIENIPGNCGFSVTGKSPQGDFNGVVYQGLQKPCNFCVRFIPPDGQRALITDQIRIEVDFGPRYQPEDGTVVPKEIKLGLTADFQGGADWRIEKSLETPGMFTLQLRPGKSLQFCGKNRIEIFVELPPITQDIFLATTFVRIAVRNLATNSIRAETRFPILRDRLQSTDVEWTIKSSHQVVDEPTCLPAGLDTYLDLEFKVSKKGYVEIPGPAQLFTINLEEVLTPDEISALARCSDENFTVSVVGTWGIIIHYASSNKFHITRETPLKLRLGPVRASRCKETRTNGRIYNMGSDRDIRVRFLVCDVKVKFDEKDQVILWEGRPSGGGGQQSWIELSVDENAHRYLGLRAEIMDFDGMLSESDLHDALNYASSLKEIKEEGRWGVTSTNARLIVRFIRNKPSATKLRGTFRGRSILASATPPQICHEESIRVLGRTQPVDKNLGVRFVGVSPGAPLVLIEDLARTLCLEIFAEQEITVVWPDPEVRIDFGALLSKEQLAALQQSPPEGFEAFLDGATLILKAKAGRFYVCHGEPIFIPLGTVSVSKPREVRGKIKLSLSTPRGGTEIEPSVVPYEFQKCTLSLGGNKGVVRNGRIYLNPAALTTFHVEVSLEDPEGRSALVQTPLARPRIQLDFGRVLPLEDVTRLAQNPPSGFSASVIASTFSLVLTAEADVLTVSNKIPIEVPIKIPPFMAPESKPYGTILAQLLHGSTLIAAEEFDVSIHHKELDASATPPVIVAWDNGAPPQLKAGTTSTIPCRFAIFNARCDRRGFSKPLVTNPWLTSEAEDDPVTPRIRLSIPPALQGGKPVPFQDKAALAQVNITAHSKGSRRWTSRSLGIYQEIWPNKSHPHILEKDDHLLVTLDKLTPKQPGIWSLAVTFVDFPGYSSATFLLPIHVGQ